MARAACVAAAMLMSAAAPAQAQVSGDNEDGVWKTDPSVRRDAGRGAFVPGQVIVKFRDDATVRVSRPNGRFQSVSATGVDQLLRRYGATDMARLVSNVQRKDDGVRRTATAPDGSTIQERDLGQIYLVRLDTTGTDFTQQLVRQLNLLPEVEYAEPNYVFHIDVAATPVSSSYDDPLAIQQWGLRAINMPKLWQEEKADATRPVIAILDTGCDITHPDLAANIWTNAVEAAGSAYADDDDNGCVDDIHGYNFVDCNSDLTDNNGHGTHCAGIAAAVGGNGIGIVGANPDAYILPVKVLSDNGEGDVATIVRGISYAIAQKANVVSMSFSSNINSQAMRDAVDNLVTNHIIAVAAAGNDRVDFHAAFGEGERYPAGYAEVVGVMAADGFGHLASFSNSDTKCQWPDKHYTVLAPGVDILSTMPGGSYRKLSGTSMAAPLVAGALSRVLQVKGYDYARDLALIGDTYFATNSLNDLLDIYRLSQYTDDNRELKPTFSASVENLDADGDGIIDAGETVDVYPVVGTTRGRINSMSAITATPVEPITLERGRNYSEEVLSKIQELNTMPSEYYDIETATVEFGQSISTGGDAMKGLNPIVVHLHDDAPQGKNVRLKFTATFNGSVRQEQEVAFGVQNTMELSGRILRDTILPAVKIIAKDCAIMPGVTVTLSDGTDLSGEILNYGTIVANSGSVLDCGGGGYDIQGRQIINGGATCRLHNNTSLYDNNGDPEAYFLFSDPGSPYSHGLVDDTMRVTPKPGAVIEGMLVVHGADVFKGEEDNPITVHGSVVFVLDKDKPEWGNLNIDGDAWFCSTYYEACADHVDTKYPFFTMSDDITISGYTYLTNVNSAQGSVDRKDGSSWSVNYGLLDYCASSDKTCKVCGKQLSVYERKLDEGTDDEFTYLYYYNDGADLTSTSILFENRNIDHIKQVTSYDNWLRDGEYVPVDLGRDESNIYSHCNIKTDPNRYESLYGVFVNSNMIGDDFRTDRGGDPNDQWGGLGHISGCNHPPYWFHGPSLYGNPFDADDRTFTIRSYCGTSNLDFINKNTTRNAWAKNWKYTAIADGADRPSPTAPGNLWYILVDGYNAFDQYDEMPPLGVGTHKVDVFFSTAMDTTVTPAVTLGRRYPYSQTECDTTGTWNSDGTAYSTTLTLGGKSNLDGINYLRVADAKDKDGMTIMPEVFEDSGNQRFKVNIQVAEAMSTNLVARAGLGAVNLTWETDSADFHDLMGYNVYRFATDHPTDTVQVNTKLILPDATTYDDYDVMPDSTYSYFIREQGTDFREFDVSNVVSVTPLPASLGDANGSGEVDVVDVVTTVNYSIGDRPKPFLFDAADVNADKQIDVLDVVGIIGMILGQDGGSTASASAVATYSIEDGTVWVDCPVALAGVQVQLTMDERTEPTVASDLDGFEHASSWLTDNDYVFLAYSMGGLTLPAGRHALLHIGAAALSRLVLSDAQGHSVSLVGGSATGIDALTTTRMRTQKGIFSLDGRKVAGDASRFGSLPSGVYIVNGQKMVK